jgi:hypothetical protein
MAVSMASIVGLIGRLLPPPSTGGDPPFPPVPERSVITNAGGRTSHSASSANVRNPDAFSPGSTFLPLPGRTRLRAHLEGPLRPVKTDIELHEEVDLSQNQRNCLRACPGEDERHGRETPDFRRQQHGAGFVLGQIAGELDGDGLLLPVRAQFCSQRVGQHVDGRAGIQQTRGGGGAALKLQNEGEKGKQAGFASQAVSGGISEASTFSRRTSSQ